MDDEGCPPDSTANASFEPPTLHTAGGRIKATTASSSPALLLVILCFCFCFCSCAPLDKLTGQVQVLDSWLGTDDAHSHAVLARNPYSSHYRIRQ